MLLKTSILSHKVCLQTMIVVCFDFVPLVQSIKKPSIDLNIHYLAVPFVLFFHELKETKMFCEYINPRC